MAKRLPEETPEWQRAWEMDQEDSTILYESGEEFVIGPSQSTPADRPISLSSISPQGFEMVSEKEKWFTVYLGARDVQRQADFICRATCNLRASVGFVRQKISLRSKLCILRELGRLHEIIGVTAQKVATLRSTVLCGDRRRPFLSPVVRIEEDPHVRRSLSVSRVDRPHPLLFESSLETMISSSNVGDSDPSVVYLHESFTSGESLDPESPLPQGLCAIGCRCRSGKSVLETDGSMDTMEKMSCCSNHHHPSAP